MACVVFWPRQVKERRRRTADAAAVAAAATLPVLLLCSSLILLGNRDFAHGCMRSALVQLLLYDIPFRTSRLEICETGS